MMIFAWIFIALAIIIIIKVCIDIRKADKEQREGKR